MQKTYNVIADHDTMRLDRWLRKNIDNLPQGLIEKLLRNGNIKVNKRKIKSSYKVREDDKIRLFNVSIKKQNHKNKNYTPSKKILTEIENEIKMMQATPQSQFLFHTMRSDQISHLIRYLRALD